MKSRSSLPPASTGSHPPLKRVTAFLIRMTPPSHVHFMTLKAAPKGPRSVFFTELLTSGPPGTPTFLSSSGFCDY
jgi:hypothetical protein